MKKASQTAIDTKQWLALEEELAALKQQHGIAPKRSLWLRLGDALAEYKEKKKAIVNRRRYIRLALIGGWFCGAHRFYAGHNITGVLYLLFCWTGIPFAMTFIDLMIALPKAADAQGNIEIGN